MSALTHLECSACGLRHEADRLVRLCETCGKPLLAQLEAMDTEIGRLLSTIDLRTTTVIFMGDNGTPNAVSPGIVPGSSFVCRAASARRARNRYGNDQSLPTQSSWRQDHPVSRS